MSLAHIQNRTEPTIFGKNLNVLNGTTTINGNVIVNGTINGTSSQGQNDNNVWTGTNTYSVHRPTCSISSVNNDDAVNEDNLASLLSSNSIINKTATWTGLNTFSQNVNVSASALSPSSATDAVTGNYLTSALDTRYNSIKTGNNVWTGTNTFTNSIPTRNTNEFSATSAVTKFYVDGSIRDFTTGNATSSVSQSPLTNYDFGTQFLVHQLQIIGGGGGSTSSSSNTSNFAGVSGGCGVTATIFLLTYSPLAVSQGLATNLGRFDLYVGGGGLAGIGCGTSAPSGNGSASVLSAGSTSGTGLSPNNYQIMRANGGFGFNGTCGQSGSTTQATYSNVNSNMIAPYSKCNGRTGTQNGGEIYQYAGYDKYGAGAPGLTSANGVQGYTGGYTLTSYEI